MLSQHWKKTIKHFAGNLNKTIKHFVGNLNNLYTQDHYLIKSNAIDSLKI